MNKNKNKPWDKNWETIEQIGSGSQGQNFFVKPRKNELISNQYVLKKLISPNDL